MATMHAAMRDAFDAPNTADAVFAAVMVSHHQGAVDMARQLLVHGKDPELRAFALGVIAEQQAEIDMLRAWSSRHAIPDSTGTTHSNGPTWPISDSHR